MGNSLTGWLIFFAADLAGALIVLRMIGKPMPFQWLVPKAIYQWVLAKVKK